MAKLYTQDEFMTAFEKSGTKGQWSDADWKNALDDPDWGMSLLGKKIRWNNATTDEERALINQEAEYDRKQKGYYGGTDGSAYNLIASPASYEYEEAPTFQGTTSGDVEDLWAKQKNYGDYVTPQYNNRYDDRINSLIDTIQNRGDFFYDPATDPLYSNYRKQYVREGQRAMQDTMGIAAAMTGGLPSSYAATAAAQQGNYYASQLADKIPELYQLAYQKYLNDDQLRRSDLSMLQSAEQNDYTKYLNDRDFGYNVYTDKYNRIANDLGTARSMNADEWNRYQDQVAQHNIEQNFKYGQYSDELASQRQDKQDALEMALIAAEQGDFSFLDKLGVDTSRNPFDYEREQAEKDRQEAQRQQEIDNAIQIYRQTGNASLLAALGLSPDLVGLNDFALAASGEYGNGGLTDEQVMQLQYALGVTMDGWWGPESMSAAGGMTAAEAWQAMQNGTLQKAGGGGYYDGGYENALHTPDADTTLTNLPYNPGPAKEVPEPLGPYITGADKGLSTTTTYGRDAADYGTTVNGTKMPSKTPTETQTDKNANAASTADMTAFTAALTAEMAGGASKAEVKGIVESAYEEGAISEAQRDQLNANVDSSSYYSGKGRRSK